MRLHLETGRRILLVRAESLVPARINILWLRTQSNKPFYAIYFRTPGGILFEIATNEPGFDRAMHDFISGYETMLRVAAEHAASVGDDGLLLAFGARTGVLAKAILAHRSFRAGELIDIDPEMLEQARSRLVWRGDKVRFKEGSHYEHLPPRNVAATSLALHHVPTTDQKRTLYQRIHMRMIPVVYSSTSM